MKRPGFMFYPKEWIWDMELRQCSPAARGLWVDLMCIMHEGEPYGHLTVPTELVLRITGLTKPVFTALLAELETERPNGKRVAYRKPDGVIFSRRMVRDEHDRATRAMNGKGGGRPAKTKASDNPVPTSSQSAWDEFANLYPRHRFDEQMACQMFISRADDAAILAGLKRAINDDDWRKEDGKFVPWASKFIADGKYTGFKAAAPEKKPAFFDPGSITRGG